MSERRAWTEHPLVQLTRVRYREFFREPEAVFWVFIFPVLLAAGLGIAFRNQRPERTIIGVIADRPGAGKVAQALQREPQLKVSLLDDSAGAMALRTGDVALIIDLGPDAQLEYRYDETRPEARTARFLVDDALQRA